MGSNDRDWNRSDSERSDPESSIPEMPAVRPRLLAVDDDAQILELYRAALGGSYDLVTASDGQEALALVGRESFDTVIVDLLMPGFDGLSFLRAVREEDSDLPVMLVSGAATLDTALKALEYGAFRFLTKPLEIPSLRGAVEYGVKLARMGRIKRQALEVLGRGPSAPAFDRPALSAHLDRALAGLWMAYQPIVSWSQKLVFAYEALVRSDEPQMGNPALIFDAAERLDRVAELGRRIRASIAESIHSIPSEAQVFVNLHPADFADADLYDPKAPLSMYASRVVLEVSERASLETVRDARPRISSLRRMGFRIAIDDLGAGHAGLSTFTQLEPDVVKLDMSLVRDADREPTKRKLIKSMTGLCKDLSMLVVIEGVETAGERDACIAAGCDLLQGYLFGKPARTITPATW